MGRLIGYMANRSDRLADALHQEREVIAVTPKDQSTGWGMGFYQGGEVLYKKRRLLKGQDIDWVQAANGVRSDCVIIHVREATVGDFRSENTHPFRMRSWLCAHNGTIFRFQAMRDRLLENMPDFIRRSIRGETDSEHFFHVILSFMHDAGQLDRPSADEGEVLRAIRSAVHLIDQLGSEVGAEKATLNVILTDGSTMYGIRRGAPMHYVVRDGVEEPLDRPSRVDRAGKPEATIRYVLLEGSNPVVTPSYREVPDESVIVVNRDLAVSMHSL